MNRHQLIAIASVVSATLSGCTGMGDMSRTMVGGAGGAAAGGLIASQVSGHPAAIAGGTILGLLAGAGTGHVLDQRQKRLTQHQADLAAQAAVRAAETRTAQQWQDTAQVHGTAVPGEVILRRGRTCRQATITSVIQHKVYSTKVCIVPGAEPGSYTVEAM